MINNLWPSYFNSTHQVARGSQEYYINSNFGRELYNATYLNLIEEDRKIIESADLVRNLHVDGLEWLKYPECCVAFRTYPKAETVFNFSDKFDIPDKYILCHPMSRPDSDRKLEDWYIERLIKQLSDKVNVVIPTEEKYLSYYDFCREIPNVTILATNLYETWWLAQNCSAFIGVDSSIRYFSLCNPEIPNFVFNKYCQQPFQCPPFQSIRWNINPKSSFPLNWDCNHVAKTILACMDDYAAFLYPEFIDNLDQAIVRRHYSS